MSLTDEPGSCRKQTCTCHVVKNRRMIRRLCGVGFFAAMLFAAISLIGLVAFAGYATGGTEVGAMQRKLLMALPDPTQYTSMADGYVEQGVDAIDGIGGTVESTVGGLSNTVADMISVIPIPFDPILGVVNALANLGDAPVLTKSPLTYTMTALIGAEHLGEANRLSFTNIMKLMGLFGGLSIGGGGGGSAEGGNLNSVAEDTHMLKVSGGLVADQLGPLLGISSMTAEEENLLLGIAMPFVITIVGTLLFCLCFPYIVCMVYSSRLCCHCCGSSKPSKKHYSPLLVMLPLIFLLLTFGVLITGTVVGIYGDHDVTAGFTTFDHLISKLIAFTFLLTNTNTQLIDNFPELIPALVSFVNEFIDRIIHVLDVELDTMVDSLVVHIRSATKGIPKKMIARVDQNVGGLVDTLDGLNSKIDLVKGLVPSINITVVNITAYTNLVKSDINLLADQLSNLTSTNWTFFGQVVAMPATPNVSSYAEMIPDVSKFADFNAINDIVKTIPNITEYVQDMMGTYDNLKNLITGFENITEPLVEQVESFQDAGTGTVKGMRNLTVALNNLKPNLVAGLSGLKDVSKSINSVRSIVNLVLFLLPWVVIILCFLPALIFRKPCFLTCMFVLYLLCMPLIHLISIPYDLFAIVLDDVCIELPNLIPLLKENYGDTLSGLTSSMPIKLNPISVYEGCQDDIPLGTQLNVLEAFDVNLTKTVDGFRGGIDDMILGQIDSFKDPTDGFNLQSTFDTVRNMNLSDIDFLGNISFSALLDNVDTMLANATAALDKLVEAKNELDFTSFNYSYEEEATPVVNGLNAITNVGFGGVYVFYTLANITEFNSSDPALAPLPAPQLTAVQGQVDAINTLLERNRSAYSLLAQIEGDMDQITSTLDVIKFDRMPNIRVEVSMIEVKIDNARGQIDPILAYLPLLENMTNTLLNNVSAMINETKTLVSADMLPNIWSSIDTFVTEASSTEGLGHCKFIPTFLDSFLGPEGAICGAFRPGFLALYLAFFLYGLVAFIFLFVVPIASKRIKFLFVSPKVNDGDEYDDIEMESVGVEGDK